MVPMASCQYINSVFLYGRYVPFYKFSKFMLMSTLAVLQLRIYAIYGRSKKVLTLTLVAFFLCFGAEISLVVLDLVKAVGTTHFLYSIDSGLSFPNVEIPVSLANTNFCANFSSWNVYWTVWAPPIIFETLLFALALYKGYQSFIEQVKNGWASCSMLDILVRDSIIYYFVYALP